MTIEEEFFKAFGIEKQHIILEDDYGQYRTRDKMYPQITAEKLLQLICMLNSTNGVNCTAYGSKTIDDLKKEILQECMQLSDDLELIQQVRKLFEE